MPYYLVVSIILFLLHSFLTLTTKINIFPELVLIPWLISKGLLIYRDFGVQHGYFLQLLLTPFSLDKSLFAMKGLYVAIQMFNLFFVLKVLKKTTSKWGFMMGGLLFVIMNYYLSDSQLWDELIVSSFYLFIYFLLVRSSRIDTKKMLFIGLLIGLVSFIKPTFIVMIIPVLFYTRSFVPLYTILLTWICSLFYFAYKNVGTAFLDNYIFYNQHYAFGSRSILSPQHILTEKSFILYTCILFSASLFFYIKNRAAIKQNPIFSFLLFSLLLFFPGYSKFNLVPFGIFFSIFVGQILGTINQKKYLIVFIIILACYGVFISHKSLQLYRYFQTNRLPYLESSKTARIVKKINSLHLGSGKTYVLGNALELYYFLDTIPPVWNMVIWQVSLQYDKTIEIRTLNEIKEKNVDVIIIPKPIDSNYSSLDKLHTYVKEFYKLLYEDSDFKLMRKFK